jgi:hypothetical protein
MERESLIKLVWGGLEKGYGFVKGENGVARTGKRPGVLKIEGEEKLCV